MQNSQDRRQFVKVTTTVGGAMALGGLPAAARAQGSEFFEVLRERRSVRKFRPDPVPEEHVRQILDAARLAPTSGNQQPWQFLVVSDRSVLDRLRDTCVERTFTALTERFGEVSEERRTAVRQSYDDYFSAPVYIVVLTDNESQYPTYNHWDGPLAAGYLMLAARALGYGTVFITDSIPDEVTSEVLSIPDRYTRVCITPIGVPESWPESPPKKDLDELIMTPR